ncbi:MAG TPA: lipocalin-like domain-containing protein [Clostridia bacterium]|nr:lipocalin-like domain-containing protein [Clostridia bacterium]
MKRLGFVCIFTSCVAAAALIGTPQIDAQATSGKAKRAVRARTAAAKMLPELKPFIGTWKLVSSMETLADGTVRPYGFGPNAVGYLMYDATAHMCAQVVNPDRPRWRNPEKPTPEEVKTAFDGFGGYCGTYSVDEKASTATHLPEVPFDPNIVGQPKPRTYRFDGDRLIYSGSESGEQGETRWEMVWERVR